MDLRDLVRHLRTTTNDSAVHRATGLNRRTVQRYRAWAADQGFLDGPLPPIEDLQQRVVATFTPTLPPQTISSVEPFRAMVLDLLATETEHVAITARLKERGFTGSYSAVRRFIQSIQPPEPDVTVRVETLPGEEAQVDFGFAGRMIDPATGKLRRAWLFVMTLSWSRHQYVEFVWDQSVATWLLLHQHAFAWFGGVPQRVRIDNLKAAILRACVDNPLIQRAYRECAEHYGFVITPCRVRTPEHKGKVERGVAYASGNFLGGRLPTLITQANQDVQTWCMTTAGLRIHGTTKTPPLQRFTSTEAALLKPLPTTAYDRAVWQIAKVHRDCYVIFDHAFYSVPFRVVGESVQIRGGLQDVRIYTADYLVLATHVRASQPGDRLTHRDHLPPTKLAGLELTTGACRLRATEIGPATTQVVEHLFADPAVDRLRTVGRMLRLADPYGEARLEAACALAIACDEPLHRTIKAILEQGLDHEPAPVVTPPPPRTFARTAAELIGHLFGGAAWN